MIPSPTTEHARTGTGTRTQQSTTDAELTALKRPRVEDSLVQVVVRDRHRRIVRRDLRWFIPVEALGSRA